MKERYLESMFEVAFQIIFEKQTHYELILVMEYVMKHIFECTEEVTFFIEFSGLLQRNSKENDKCKSVKSLFFE